SPFDGLRVSGGSPGPDGSARRPFDRLRVTLTRSYAGIPGRRPLSHAVGERSQRTRSWSTAPRAALRQAQGERKRLHTEAGLSPRFLVASSVLRPQRLAHAAETLDALVHGGVRGEEAGDAALERVHDEHVRGG